jgi:hypothetical protein
MSKYSVSGPSGSRKKIETTDIQHNALGSSDSCPKKERGVIPFDLKLTVAFSKSSTDISPLESGC